MEAEAAVTHVLIEQTVVTRLLTTPLVFQSLYFSKRIAHLIAEVLFVVAAQAEHVLREARLEGEDQQDHLRRTLLVGYIQLFILFCFSHRFETGKVNSSSANMAMSPVRPGWFQN